MGVVVRKIIYGCELINRNIVKADFHLNNTGYTLLKGVVLSPIGEVLANVAIQVTIMDENYNPPKKKFVGVTFSHEDGSYAISVPIKIGYMYELITYTP